MGFNIENLENSLKTQDLYKISLKTLKNKNTKNFAFFEFLKFLKQNHDLGMVQASRNNLREHNFPCTIQCLGAS